VLVLLALMFSPRVLAADNYNVDPVHSFVTFRIQHLQVSYTYGRFNEPQGKLVIDESDAAKSSMEFTLQVDKVDTGNPGRDAHLKKADFFSAAEFPQITFKSTAIKKVDDKTWEVTGDLSLHGVTKSLTVQAKRIGTGPGMKGETRTGLETLFTIKRSDFGMNFMIPQIGDDVTLAVGIEAIKQ
jgi:polyisoprenoid-binding protein YceI